MNEQDKLTEKYFREYRQEIPDDGFSRRVMNRLPGERTRRLDWLWTAMCVAACITVFFLTDGWQQLTGNVRSMATETVQWVSMEVAKRDWLWLRNAAYVAIAVTCLVAMKFREWLKAYG